MDMFSKPRKVPPQNIVIRLFDRQTNGGYPHGTHFHAVRRFYQCVFPNFTITNIEKPPCFLRKFSPNGKYLIAVSANQMSLEIYTYKGPAAGCELVHDGCADERKHFDIKNKIFDKFFKLKYSVKIAETNEAINRECSLFTDDSRYVIVGSASHFPEHIRPHFYEIYTNNESVTPNYKSPLEDYTLHLIDIENGKLCDTRRFPIDKIFMSHNQGLYLYKDILAVLSVQHQVIYIYQVLDGMFIDVRKIGRFCFEDDAFHFNSVYPTERAFKEVFINSLKHRILIFLYKRAAAISAQSNNPYELRRFYQYFENFKALRIWKMQLLDENHILIKYASEDVVTMKALDANSFPAFFVVYNMTDSKVLAIYDNVSQELMDHMENFADCFRNTNAYCCSLSNNIYARVLHHRHKQTIISAKYGGKTEARKRLLALLPISAQSYTSSPYLDLSLFSYDDKWISIMERPKPCGEHPIRFYGRDSGLLKFRIFAGGGSASRAVPSARRLVAFTFHPTDPFAITVQRTNSEYIVNFHMRFDKNCVGIPEDLNVLT